MNRIAHLDPATTNGPAKQLFDAVLKLAQSIVVQRGELGPTGLDQARAAGLTDGDIVETVAHVARNIFSNYLNHMAGTVIDFPEVPLAQGHAASSCACG